MMDLLLETACEWWCLRLEAFIGLRSYGEAFGPERQISMYNQFFHFVTAVGRRRKSKNRKPFFANLDLSAVCAGLYAVYKNLMTRIRMYQAEK